MNKIGQRVGGPEMLRTWGCRLALAAFAVLASRTAAQPTISQIGAQQVQPGDTLGPLVFRVSSTSVPAADLTVAATSSDQSIVRNGNISIYSGADPANRTLFVTPELSVGTVTITLTVSDGVLSVSTSFSLTVWHIELPRINNPAAIPIPDASAALLYPSRIAVDRFNGYITKLEVTLYGFTHTFPRDVGVLLVGPTGQKVVLMNSTGGGHPGAVNDNLTFAQTSSLTIPTNGPVTSGTFLPEDNSGGTRTFLSPAPPGPYTNTLDDFRGTSPNGEWSLYVQDFEQPDSGSISNGWGLLITPMGPASLIIQPFGGGLKFSANGAFPNAPCTLQSSADLKNWTNATVTNADGFGSAEFQVAVTNSLKHQFYRIVSR